MPLLTIKEMTNADLYMYKQTLCREMANCSANSIYKKRFNDELQKVKQEMKYRSENGINISAFAPTNK